METNLHQVIPQTHEEKVAMYMKEPIGKIIEMLIECNRILDARPLKMYTYGGEEVKNTNEVNSRWERNGAFIDKPKPIDEAKRIKAINLAIEASVKKGHFNGYEEMMPYLVDVLIQNEIIK